MFIAALFTIAKTWKQPKIPKQMNGWRFGESESHSVVSNSLWPHGLYTPWNSSPQPEYWMGSLSLLQGIFPTQGSNPGLLHCRRILYQLSYKGSPRILEWVAYPFSSGSSWLTNRARVSCIAGGFFTNWAIRKDQMNGWFVTYIQWDITQTLKRKVIVPF